MNSFSEKLIPSWTLLAPNWLSWCEPCLSRLQARYLQFVNTLLLRHNTNIMQCFFTYCTQPFCPLMLAPTQSAQMHWTSIWVAFALWHSSIGSTATMLKASSRLWKVPEHCRKYFRSNAKGYVMGCIWGLSGTVTDLSWNLYALFP